MIARLQEVNRIASNQIDDAMLLSQPARPDVGANVLELSLDATPSLFRFIPAKFVPQGSHGLRLCLSRSRSLKGGQQTRCVPWGTQLVQRGFQAFQLGCRNQRHIFSAASMDNDLLKA